MLSMTTERPQLFPDSIKHPLEHENTFRRVAAIANLTRSSHVLDVGENAGFAALFLARSIECHGVVADRDETNLQKVIEQGKALSLAGRITTRKMEGAEVSFSPGEFDAIFARADLSPLPEVAKHFREALGLRGRLWVSLPLKVGRYPSRPTVEFWERRLGQSVLEPKDALLIFEQGGFEPETVQTLGDSELADFYREIERTLAGKPEQEVQTWRQEIELFRSQSAKTSVAYGWILARRKEPGEKPPQTRERG
jgi:SAM-dependent methyltransferase